MKQPIVDLRRESECNGVENYVAIEAMEVGRQRAEAAQWTFQRIKNSLDNQQTSLSGNSVFKHIEFALRAYSNSAILVVCPIKVHIFWEGHKILRNLPLTFDYSTYSQK